VQNVEDLGVVSFALTAYEI